MQWLNIKKVAEERRRQAASQALEEEREIAGEKLGQETKA